MAKQKKNKPSVTLDYVSIIHLVTRHTSAMSDIPSLLAKLLHDLSEENYDRTFSAYRFWIELGAAHGGVPNDKLSTDIQNNTRPDLLQASYQELTSQGNTRQDWVNSLAGQLGYIDYNMPPSCLHTFSGKLIHDNVPLLLRFISDAELDPVLSTYANGLHDRWCGELLQEFFWKNLYYTPGERTIYSRDFCAFYTNVNLIAHWINLGHVQLEDVRDRILQSLTFQPTVHPHQLNSLMILLKISGATFAAYVDPSIMDRCCDLLKPSNLGSKLVATGLAEVRTPILMLKIIYEC